MKNFKVGDYHIIMDYDGALEIWINYVKENRVQFLRFETVESFKAMGERMVKEAVRGLK